MGPPVVGVVGVKYHQTAANIWQFHWVTFHHHQYHLSLNWMARANPSNQKLYRDGPGQYWNERLISKSGMW